MPLNLIGLTFLNQARPKRLPYNNEHVDLTRTDNVLHEWRILVRGPRVLFVSPPGWAPGIAPAERRGPTSEIIEVARNQLALHWSGVEGDVGEIEKWSPPAAPAAKAEGKGKDARS